VVSEIYARVTAKRPEAAIVGLIWKPGEARTNNLGRWLRNGHRWTAEDVEALFVAHWLTLCIVDGYSLSAYPNLYRVEYGHECKVLGEGKTPFLALASYLERLP